MTSYISADFGSQSLLIFGGDLSEITPREELVKILECPVCQEIPLPPIYNCVKGHIICIKCRKKLSKCPLCKYGFTESRNFVLESIIQTSKFVCDYHEEGCNSILSGSSLQKHLEDCEFRPLICHLGKLDGCNHTVIEFSNYFEHLLRVHNMIGGIEEDEDTFIIRQTFMESKRAKQNWLCTYKKYNGNIFLTRSWKIGIMFHWSLAMIGSNSEAAKYAVRITIDPPVGEDHYSDSKIPNYDVTIPVVSIRKTKEDIQENYPYAVLPENALRGYCTTINTTEKRPKIQWRTQYRIIKLNEGDGDEKEGHQNA